MILSDKQQEARLQIQKTKVLICWWRVGSGKTRVAVAAAEDLRNGSVSEEGGIWLAVLRRKAFWDLQNELVKTNTSQHWIIEEFDSQVTWKHGEWKLWMVSAAQLKKYEKQLSKIGKAIKFIFVDELYMFGNPTSQRSKSLRNVVGSSRATRLGVSGTIMPSEDNTTIFGQAKAIGIESYVAPTLTEFRSRYQICRVEDLQRYKIVKRINKPHSVKAITARIERFVNIHFPKSTKEIKIQDTKVPLTPQQIKYIKQITKDYWYEIEPIHAIQNGSDEGSICPPTGTSLSSPFSSELHETNTALEVATRLRQVTSGWLPTSTGFVRIPTNKTIALKESVEELLAANEQVLIWCAFRRDIEIISPLFDVPLFQMVGGKPFDVAKFEREKPRVVVATQGSGSSVNHFRDFKYSIYYSQSYDWLSLEQSMGRTDRKDSVGDSRHYQFIICDSPSIDAYVLENARQAGATEKTFLKLFDKWKQENQNR